MRRVLAVMSGAMTAAMLSAAPALACGGLIGPNGAVNLTRTTTFAGYAGGVEHYVTAFNFAGGTGKFGSITPLPGVPTKVERGGDWTLQRLVRETTPIVEFAASASSSAASSAAPSAQVLLEAKVDALDITILKGNGDEVGRWAKANGFRLPPDAPEVLDFYAQRSPIFMAAAFDADRAKARGQQVGDGTPIHLTIPTRQPWVPLRILGLGKKATDVVEADIYLLTARRPAMLPAPTPLSQAVPGDAEPERSLLLTYDRPADSQLLRDLHDDKSGSWVPLEDMWLTKIAIGATAGSLKYDLAIDPTGNDKPSIVNAGYTVNGLRPPSSASAAPAPTADPITPHGGPATVAADREVVAPASGRRGAAVPIALGVCGALLAVGAGVAMGHSGRRTP